MKAKDHVKFGLVMDAELLQRVRGGVGEEEITLTVPATIKQKVSEYAVGPG